MKIEFPSADRADADGLLAVGGNLEPETLMAAYSQGIFPWFSEGQSILWWTPDPRMVLFPSEFYCSKRLARRLRQSQYRISWDESFVQVINACASVSRSGENGTWLVPEMIKAYEHLHRLGFAHSVEVWQQNELIGGVYGVVHQGVFFAESMFSAVRDGSKMALANLVEKAKAKQWKLIDCQFYTSHLESLGGREIPRSEFMRILQA